MRRATHARIWTDLYAKASVVKLDRLALRKLAPLGDLDIAFFGGITAICGANGVGKTTVLRLIRRALVGDASLTLNHQLRNITTGELQLDVTDRRGPFSVVWSAGTASKSPSPPVKIATVDPLQKCPNHLASLYSEAAADELIQSIEPNVLAENERREIAYIAGRDYSEIKIFEIEELADEDDDPIPYFVVTEHGHTYTSLSMGMGELSLLYMWWKISRTEALSIVILEEPENFVTPFSQERFLLLLAKYVERRNLWAIVSTHSPNILNILPLEHIRLLRRNSNGFTCTTPMHSHELSDALGVRGAFKAVICVEDARAKDLLHALLARHGFPYQRDVEIVTTGGEAKLLAVVQNLPSAITRVAFIGVLDGDQRKHQHPSVQPLYYLPSDVSPETMFRQFLSSHSDYAALELGLENHVLSGYLSALAGLEDHDWFVDLAAAVGVTPAQLMSHLVKVWLVHSELRSQASELVSSIAECCRKALT